MKITHKSEISDKNNFYDNNNNNNILLAPYDLHTCTRYTYSQSCGPRQNEQHLHVESRK